MYGQVARDCRKKTEHLRNNQTREWSGTDDKGKGKRGTGKRQGQGERQEQKQRKGEHHGKKGTSSADFGAFPSGAHLGACTDRRCASAADFGEVGLAGTSATADRRGPGRSCELGLTGTSARRVTISETRRAFQDVDVFKRPHLVGTPEKCEKEVEMVRSKGGLVCLSFEAEGVSTLKLFLARVCCIFSSHRRANTGLNHVVRVSNHI